MKEEEKKQPLLRVGVFAITRAGNVVRITGEKTDHLYTSVLVTPREGSKFKPGHKTLIHEWHAAIIPDSVVSEMIEEYEGTCQEEGHSISAPLTGEFALTEVGSLVLVKEPATPDTYKCIVVAPSKESSHYVGEVIRCHQYRISKVLPDKVAEIITETMSVQENKKFKKGDAVIFKDDCNTLYRLGSEKNADTFYCMRYKIEKTEGVNSIKISPCEININLIKGLAPSKLVEQVKTVLSNLGKLL